MWRSPCRWRRVVRRPPRAHVAVPYGATRPRTRVRGRATPRAYIFVRPNVVAHTARHGAPCAVGPPAGRGLWQGHVAVSCDRDVRRVASLCVSSLAWPQPRGAPMRAARSCGSADIDLILWPPPLERVCGRCPSIRLCLITNSSPSVTVLRSLPYNVTPSDISWTYPARCCEIPDSVRGQRRALWLVTWPCVAHHATTDGRLELSLIYITTHQ